MMLPVIHSRDENDDITRICNQKASGRCLLGYQSPPNNPGGHTVDSFVWADNSTTDYRNWKKSSTK
eukprot:TRINITY_DN5494_c0_g1_i1.p2 TRINITY_DN5494_c0_g1~~TRINITY_DN5494_c0_g1_i1.p2  ORF type:complete len:66 (-),score=4.04 TRINITY_DN5494_c0_g1_i1:170-367(-)